jgi:hypothetical protein
MKLPCMLTQANMTGVSQKDGARFSRRAASRPLVQTVRQGQASKCGRANRKFAAQKIARPIANAAIGPGSQCRAFLRITATENPKQAAARPMIPAMPAVRQTRAMIAWLSHSCGDQGAPATLNENGSVVGIAR